METGRIHDPLVVIQAPRRCIMFRFLTPLVRAVRNRILAFQGISCCLHCKNRWGVVKGEPIPCAPNRGMFPVCTECFARLDADQIVGYCNALVDRWLLDPPVDDEQEMRRVAAEFVRETKQRTTRVPTTKKELGDTLDIVRSGHGGRGGGSFD